jgi:hypothetical protein
VVGVFAPPLGDAPVLLAEGAFSATFALYAFCLGVGAFQYQSICVARITLREKPAMNP